jgi:KaiC/GvpD/RAD55 family RecA-like ATPase
VQQTITIKRFLRKKFKLVPLAGVWQESFGQPERGAIWLVYGGSGNGKTEFAAQLAKAYAEHGKVLYVSAEQGWSSSLQKCFARNGFADTKNITLGTGYDTLGLLTDLAARKKPPDTIVLDSVDYLRFTKEDLKQFQKQCPGMTIILISWEKGGKPQTSQAQAMQYMADVKVRITKFVAFSVSRIGGNAPFVIWQKGAEPHHPWLNAGGYDK